MQSAWRISDCDGPSLQERVRDIRSVVPPISGRRLNELDLQQGGETRLCIALPGIRKPAEGGSEVGTVDFNESKHIGRHFEPLVQFAKATYFA
jgi:hypothetical protein